MKTIQNLFGLLAKTEATKSVAIRVRAGRAPVCESLEGRRLMSADATGWISWPATGTPPTGAPPADVHAFDATGHTKGPDGHGGPAGAKFTLSAAAKADMTTLQNDMKALQSEVPASITSALKADQAIIAKAFASMAPTTHQAPPKAELGKPGDRPTKPPGDPSADIVTLLEKAGVSSTEATQIQTDFTNYQNALKTLDPTLQTKITADQAAIKKDGGPEMPSAPAGALPVGGPMMMAPPPTATTVASTSSTTPTQTPAA